VVCTQGPYLLARGTVKKGNDRAIIFTKQRGLLQKNVKELRF
jgi:hypothetical protein